MPLFLAFLAGGLFVSVASKSTRNNLKTAKEDFDEILDDKQKLEEKVEEILRKKDL
jgi:hypothetical protein